MNEWLAAARPVIELIRAIQPWIQDWTRVYLIKKVSSLLLLPKQAPGDIKWKQRVPGSKQKEK